LCQWAVKFNINHNALDGLLVILKKVPALSQLPKDSRSILVTRKTNETLCLTKINPGLYYHFGLRSAILEHFKFISTNNIDVIKIVIGIDGLPISKSSASQLWPILGYIRPFKNSVFPIGIYWGHEKPEDSNLYLKQFYVEAKELLTNGVNINGVIFKVIIDGFSLDAPAKSFVLKVKGHSGYDSCTRCIEEGEYLKNRSCFPYTASGEKKRTHDDYVNMKYEEHHVGNTISILSDLPGVNMVDAFALDYMHLVCIGVMKKLIQLWMNKGPLNVRIPSSVVKIISDQLVSFKKSIPCDFSRKPRALNELPRFKATELRQILLYTGQVVFKDNINSNCYMHFMTLNIAMTILLSDNMKKKYTDFARNLLKYFVQNFEKLYGRHFISHNVHGLLHISDDYNNFGPLDNISAFPFENYMKTLKKMIKKHDKPLQQIIKRFYEQKNVNTHKNTNTEIVFKNEHTNGPMLNNLIAPQFKIVHLLNTKIKTTCIADQFILTIDNNIMKVLNIAHTKDTNEVVFIGKIFQVKRPFYEEPLSSDTFDIYIVDSLSDELCWIPMKNFKKKVMLFEKCNEKIALPIIHSIKDD